MITPTSRFYVGILESKIVYAERTFDKDENVKSLDRFATLDYGTLEVSEERPVPVDLKPLMDKHVAMMKANVGKRFYVNANRTSYVTLGSVLLQRQQAEQ